MIKSLKRINLCEKIEILRRENWKNINFGKKVRKVVFKFSYYNLANKFSYNFWCEILPQKSIDLMTQSQGNREIVFSVAVSYL